MTGGGQLLAPETRASLPALLPHWQHVAAPDAPDAIERTFRFRDFTAAWAFMTQVASLAERHDHHPDWSNAYGRVTIRLTTHDAGGLTGRDLRLAQAIDAV